MPEEASEILSIPQQNEVLTGGAEFKEIPEDNAKFLAGIFEMGAGMSIEHKIATVAGASGVLRQKQQVQSQIYFTDTSEEKIKQMELMFGGKSRELKGTNSWRWSASGSEALHVLNSIQSFAPNRQEEIKAFQRLAEMNTLEDKIAISKAMSLYNNSPKSYPDPIEYKHLVQDPAFIAGVYESRGNVYVNNEEDTPLNMTSLNISLLTVLQEQYGGSVSPVIRKEVGSKPDESIEIPFRYALGKGDRRKFLQVAYPYLISDRTRVEDILKQQAA